MYIDIKIDDGNSCYNVLHAFEMMTQFSAGDNVLSFYSEDRQLVLRYTPGQHCFSFGHPDDHDGSKGTRYWAHNVGIGVKKEALRLFFFKEYDELRKYLKDVDERYTNGEKVGI